MLNIQIIRHGMTPGNQLRRYIGTTDESLLSEEEQRLKNLSFEQPEAVFCSPLRRCKETAGILFPDKELVLVRELAECDFGRFENKNYKELEGDAEYQAWIDSNGTLPFPGGESREDFSRRCMDGLSKIVYICYRQKIHSIAMVVHGGTIMSILSQYGLPKKDYYDWSVSNGCGYFVHLEEQTYLHGTPKLYVDAKIGE